MRYKLEVPVAGDLLPHGALQRAASCAGFVQVADLKVFILSSSSTCFLWAGRELHL